jgi:tetratricopeptide (TPR) repeat protein
MRLLCILLSLFFATTIFAQKKLSESVEIEAMFEAELFFQQRAFKLALEGREKRTIEGTPFLGFISIIEKYKGTKSANMAHYYAGVCYLNLGEYEKSIKFFEAYKAVNPVLEAMTYNLLGDAYAELNLDKDALSYYKKAASTTDDDQITPSCLYKVGLFMEVKMKDLKKAKDYYLTIERDYPEFAEEQGIERDLIRVSN